MTTSGFVGVVLESIRYKSVQTLKNGHCALSNPVCFHKTTVGKIFSRQYGKVLRILKSPFLKERGVEKLERCG